MIKLIYISFLVFGPLFLYGQENQNSSEQKEKKENLQIEFGKDKQTILKDSSSLQQTSISDSSCDNKNKCGMNKQKMRKRLMDNFMDKDGDGINDCRANGMGWHSKGKHKGFGRHGK